MKLLLISFLVIVAISYTLSLPLLYDKYMSFVNGYVGSFMIFSIVACVVLAMLILAILSAINELS